MIKIGIQYFGGRGSGGGKGASGGGASSGGAAAASQTSAASVQAGQRISRVTEADVQKIFNAPEGTKIQITNHNEGEYMGEYTKQGGAWVGSQQYRSSYRTPPTVKTEKGLSMNIRGEDIKVLKVGR